MVFQLICWWVSYTFVLASSALTCEKDLSEVPYFVLYGCQFGCAVLCGLVPDCGFAIARRSSRSPQGFGASLPVAWSHPTLAGIKLFTRCSQQIYPCSRTYCREDQAILVLVYIGTYQLQLYITADSRCQPNLRYNFSLCGLERYFSFKMAVALFCFLQF